ncbi:hypothetical protein [Streptomyces sp. NPDC017940]
MERVEEPLSTAGATVVAAPAAAAVRAAAAGAVPAAAGSPGRGCPAWA